MTVTDTGPVRPRRGRLRVTPWFVMMLLATLLALFSLHYLRPGMPDGFFVQIDVYRQHAFWLLLHVVGGVVALAIGPWQFLSGLRRRRLRLHRWLGRAYVAAVAAGSFGGMYMAFLAFGGTLTQTSFLLLSMLWFGATWIAVGRVLDVDIAAHRRWMVRSYALTFAAVTLRLWLLGLGAVLPLEVAYQAASWLAWVPNLIFAECLLRRRDRSPVAMRNRHAV